MGIWIHVACRSDKPITYGELEDVMGHMGWLDQPARFDPPIDDRNKSDPNWGFFQVKYRPEKRPILVHHYSTEEEMGPAFEDIHDKLDDTEGEIAHTVATHLKSTMQMFVFEIPDDLPEDVWTMLDVTEAFLARECDGIVVSEEGVFDSELNQILRF